MWAIDSMDSKWKLRWEAFSSETLEFNILEENLKFVISGSENWFRNLDRFLVKCIGEMLDSKLKLLGEILSEYTWNPIQSFL